MDSLLGHASWSMTETKEMLENPKIHNRKPKGEWLAGSLQ